MQESMSGLLIIKGIHKTATIFNNKLAIAVAIICMVGFSTAFSQPKSPDIYVANQYTIRFPNAYKKSTQTVPSPLGDLLMTLASYEPKPDAGDSNYLYMIIETDYPDSAINSNNTDMLERFFRGSIDGAVKNVKGKLLTEEKGTVGIYPSRTIEVDFQNGLAVIKMTMVLRENKMIMIQSITNTANYPNSWVSRFFNSFKLK